jgi:hypothetical protein
VLLEGSGRFIGPGHAGIFKENGTNWFTFHYYDGNENGAAKLGLARLDWSADGWPVLSCDWSAYYTFSVDAREHMALYNGSLSNGATVISDGAFGNVLSLNGASQYALLSNPAANACTFALWVKWGGGADWQRVFDFGSNTTRYCFLTPRASNGKMRFAITTNGISGEKTLDAPFALPTNSWCHVAVTADGTRGVLYVNGSSVATNTSLKYKPWQVMARTNYLGRSQFADPFFNGRIQSFRSFHRALGGAEIRDLAFAPPGLAHRYSFTSNAWDSIGMAHGTLFGNAVITNGALKLTGSPGCYAKLPGGLVSGCAAVTVEFWAVLGVSGNWARVFDFGSISGSSGTRYLFFSPHTSASTHRLEINSGSVTRTMEVPGVMDNRTVCVACIVDPANGYSAIYTNGVLEKAFTNSLPALSTVNSGWAFLGRSLFSSDAWLNATIDEFRIYDGRLTPGQIAVDFKSGPDELALPFRAEASDTASSLSMSWPSYAAGYVPEVSAQAGSLGWTAISNAAILDNDRWRFDLRKTNPAAFLRLRR